VVGCARAAPTERELQVGAHRVFLVPPIGWEVLEHGRQAHFRNGEMQISLTDLGPATSEGMVREIGVARAIWIAGRRRDAFARVRTLQAPILRLASSDQRAAFWQDWYAVTDAVDRADSADIASGFEVLIQGAGKLPEIPPPTMTEYVLETHPQADRREIAEQTRPVLHGRAWTELETWNRVSHLDPSRVAFLDDGGYLLELAIERGPIEVTGPVFEQLLSSIEATTVSPEAR
jgi:hypothetical protein